MHTSLQNLVNKKTIPNTLLFCGHDIPALLSEARLLAAALMGPEHTLKLEKQNHPDLHHYAPEGILGMHPMENMRSLINEVSLPPFEAPISLYVIEEAHRMLPSSSNALLKTLEEPTPHAYIILITSQPSHLLPTIISRARRIDFNSIATASTANPHLARLLTEPLSYTEHLALYETIETEIDAAHEGHAKALAHQDLLTQILTHHRNLHFTNTPTHSWDRLLTTIEKSRLALERSIKLRTVLDYLFLNIEI